MFYTVNKIFPENIQLYNFIENNTLQNPFYEQVFKPLFNEKAKSEGYLNIVPDERNKPDKFSRIEGNLEPINREGKLILNRDKQDNPHFKRLEEQFLLITPKLPAPADGPDCVEGGVWKINEKLKKQDGKAVQIGQRPKNKKRF